MKREREGSIDRGWREWPRMREARNIRSSQRPAQKGRAGGSIPANEERITQRFGADGSSEAFYYSARGLTSHLDAYSSETSFEYDELGRKTAEVNRNGETNRFSYNGAGDLLTLTDGNNHVTTWKYDQYGQVTNKIDHLGSNMFLYTYDANGRLASRWTPAKGTTSYGYDAVGNLTSIDYPSSADIALAYDANNRLTNMVDAVGTTKFTYTGFGALASEDGPWNDDTVSYSYDSARRRGQMSLKQMNSSDWTQTYAYDAIGRLTSTASPAGLFSYSYISSNVDDLQDFDNPTCPTLGNRVEQLLLPNGAYIANQYDSMKRLTETALITSKITNRHAYAYDWVGQRTNHVRTGGDYVAYTYDAIGQLKTATGKENGGTTNRLNEQFGYAYDAAGNLTFRTNNGLVQTFMLNDLNQVTNVARSGTLTVAGSISVRATSVTVNSQPAARYGDNTFAKSGISLSNGTNTFTAVAQDVSNRSDTDSANAYLPASPILTYDANGNLLYDGQTAFAYDDENELIGVTLTNRWKSEFLYDREMRRRVRKEYAWKGGTWALTNEVRYVYDGPLVIQERNAHNVSEAVYTRGLDLRVSLENGGGIGGLLAKTVSTTPSALHSYYHSDGNGNVSMLINTQQVLTVKYLYDPFGNLLSCAGLGAVADAQTFSGKEWNPNSGLCYFLRRFYHPALQRWISRDPLEEWDDFNLYRIFGNDTVDYRDAFGLEKDKGCMDDCISDFNDCVGFNVGSATALGGAYAAYQIGTDTGGILTQTGKMKALCKAGKLTKFGKAVAGGAAGLAIDICGDNFDCVAGLFMRQSACPDQQYYCKFNSPWAPTGYPFTYPNPIKPPNVNNNYFGGTLTVTK